MNKVTVAVGVVVLLVIGGIIVYASQNTTWFSPGANTTSTTEVVVDVSPTSTPPVQARQPGRPLVTTSANVAASDIAAVLGGVVTPNGALTSYWYEYSTSSDLNNKISGKSQTVGSGFVSISAPGYITELAKNTTYYFRLVALNQYGQTVGTQYSFQTSPSNPPIVGSVPVVKTLAANQISRITANLNGEVTPNKVSTQYWFEYGKTADLGNTTAIISAGNGMDRVSVSASLASLDPNTTYYFRLNAQNQFGTVNGMILNFKTTGPVSAAAPSVITRSAINISTSSVTLRGTVNPNGAETRYWYEYSPDSIFSSALLRSTEQKSVGAGSSVISVDARASELIPRTNYYFRGVAQNSLGLVRGEPMVFKTK